MIAVLWGKETRQLIAEPRTSGGDSSCSRTEINMAPALTSVAHWLGSSNLTESICVSNF